MSSLSQYQLELVKGKGFRTWLITAGSGVAVFSHSIEIGTDVLGRELSLVVRRGLRVVQVVGELSAFIGSILYRGERCLDLLEAKRPDKPA